MSKTLDEAVAQLERDPEQAVTAEVSGMVVELRFRGRRTAADVFREVGPWEGESQQELTDLLRKARRLGWLGSCAEGQGAGRRLPGTQGRRGLGE